MSGASSTGQTPGDRKKAGANVVGYLRSEMGVGEAARCTIKAARAVSLPIALRTVDDRGPYRLGDQSVASLDRDQAQPVNLIHVNADQAETVIEKLGPEFVDGRYNIGHWVWELEEFPRRWLPAFRFFDEIWTPSAFCQAAIARISPVPVLRMPYAIEVDPRRELDRSAFSIPDTPFVFLAMFDLLSVVQRKNPLGTLAAFRKTFESIRDCHLVLKISHARQCPEEMKTIVAAAEGLPVTIIDRTIDRTHVNDLIRACDCVVSLHRSEGFGLTLAEAMYLNKPVIATGYSGNVDFTRPDNAFLVDYDLVHLPKGCAPYEEGAVWAEPDIGHAISQMRLALESPEIRNARASRGAGYVRRNLAPEVIGKLMRQRLALVLSR